MPHLNEVADELADEPVTFLMVTDEDPEMIEEFVTKRKMPGWVVVDKDQSTFKTFKISARPRTIVIDRSGTWLLDLKPEQLTADLVRRVISGEVRATEHYMGLDPIEAATLGPEALPPARFGEFELINGTEQPIRTGFHGLASPSTFDYDGDGKKDLLLGEFETGPSMLKVFKNIGSNKNPSFTGEWEYARTITGKNMFIDSW